MSLRNYLLITVAFSVMITSSTFSQGKFKAGVGFNFISNNLDNEYLDSYFAQSLHLSYAFYQEERFSMSVESSSSLKSTEGDYGRKTGFITSLPVTAQYAFRKIALHAGAGPAYLYQRTNYFQQKYQMSGSSLHLLTGIAWKGEPILADLLYPEFTVRLNYFKSFRGNEYDAGMISFIIFLRGPGRAGG
jgi:hypothetical protein